MPLKSAAPALLACLLASLPLQASAALTAYWAGENNALDSAGNHDGSLQGNTGYAPGYIGQAFNFDGDYDYVELGKPVDLQFTQSLTMSAWVRPTAYGPQQIILNYENSYEVALNNNNGTLQYALYCCGGSSWYWQDTGIVAPLNEWTGFTISYGSGVVNVYDGNGNLVRSNNAPASIDPPLWAGATLRIGARSGNRSTDVFVDAGSFFQGQIDEVKLFDTAVAPVPIPAAASLFGSALFGLGVFGYRGRRSPSKSD